MFFTHKSFALMAATLLAVCPLTARTPNKKIEQLVSEISADRIAATQKKLESFGTRNIYSAINDPSHGIGAAREWIAAQFRSYNPSLQVSFDKHTLKGDPKAVCIRMSKSGMWLPSCLERASPRGA